MPAPFSANRTLPIAALLASDASRAVLASVVTPASICAKSGGTEMRASPVTEMNDGGWSVAALPAAAKGIAAASATGRNARGKIRLFMRSSLQGHVDVDHQLVLRRLQ